MTLTIRAIRVIPAIPVILVIRAIQVIRVICAIRVAGAKHVAIEFLPLFNTRIWDFSTAANGSHGSQGSQGSQDLLRFTIYQFHLQVSRLPFKRQITLLLLLIFFEAKGENPGFGAWNGSRILVFAITVLKTLEIFAAPPNGRKATTHLFTSAVSSLDFFFFESMSLIKLKQFLLLLLFQKKRWSRHLQRKEVEDGSNTRSRSKPKQHYPAGARRRASTTAQSGEGGTQHRPKGDKWEELPLYVTLPYLPSP